MVQNASRNLDEKVSRTIATDLVLIAEDDMALVFD